jgi:hypothetical protein
MKQFGEIGALSRAEFETEFFASGSFRLKRALNDSATLVTTHSPLLPFWSGWARWQRSVRP